MPGKSHGLRSFVGYSPWGRKESDMTERLLSLSLICISTYIFFLEDICFAVLCWFLPICRTVLADFLIDVITNFTAEIVGFLREWNKGYISFD